MKISRLLNKKYFLIIFYFFIGLTINAEEQPVDIWNIDKKKIEKDASSENITNDINASEKINTNIFNIMQYDAALTLLVFGIFLAVIRLSLKTISYGIGLHAGFVFVIKTTKQVSNVDLNSEHKYLVSNHDQFLGSASTIWITTLLIIYLFYKFKAR